MNSNKAVLFDFNGTLFWDSPFHDTAWSEFAGKYASRNISGEEMKENVHGRTNPDILNYVFNKQLSEKEIHQYTRLKEELYIRLIQSDNGLHHLAPGAEDLLCYLTGNEIPINIATSSEKGNVEFFFQHLDLYLWFDFEKVVYFDGSFNPKPAPDIFLIAAENINVPIEDCLVLEDSIAGIEAARKAGAKTVVYVENNTPLMHHQIDGLVDGKISNLKEIKKFL